MNKMMKRIGYLFLSCLSILLLANCTEESDFATMVYSETKCADRWNTNENDSEEDVRNAVVDYLFTDLRIDITTIDFSFDENVAQECEACSCTTGRIITIDVEKNQVDRLEVIGFILKN